MKRKDTESKKISIFGMKVEREMRVGVPAGLVWQSGLAKLHIPCNASIRPLRVTWNVLHACQRFSLFTSLPLPWP